MVYKVSPTQIKISDFLDTNYSLKDACAFWEVFSTPKLFESF